jgi:cysteinyl-tRNA synthetase
MRLYNTLNRGVNEFIPRDGNNVNMYTCGPTVYHYAHIGNLRTYIFEDILEKSLKYLGYNVKRVMNITDVGHLTSDSDSGEDKMLKGAKRENKTVLEIADMYTKAFKSDCDKLNIRWPDIVSKATDNIDMYIKIITKLLDDGYAYVSCGNVYFDTSKLDDYYKLTNHKIDEMVVGVREGVEEDSNKRNQADFVLWFTKSKFQDQELKWDSPWGVGYPGWHIECSGIAIKYLGEYLDIHCGGVDNIFPHHTNEIAQSEAYLGHEWCNFWVHGEHLNDKSGKMSKSKGDFLTVSLLEEKGYDPLCYRYLCLNSYYHNILTFSYDILDGAFNEYKKLKSRVLSIVDGGVYEDDKFNLYNDRFKEALSNDLNTSTCITILYDLLKDSDISGRTKLELIKSFDSVLSLDLLKDEVIDIDSELKDYIEDMINKRNEYKKNKEYDKADMIRDELLNRGVVIKDTREGTIFEVVK